MNRCNCATSFSVVDGLELIKQERKRLEGIVASKDFKYNPHWQWMLKWLTKTDEQHLQKKLSLTNWTTEMEDAEVDKNQDYIDNEYHCAICFKPKRYMLFSEFSFCQEYGCGIHICRECAIELGNLAKTLPEPGEGAE